MEPNSIVGQLYLARNDLAKALVDLEEARGGRDEALRKRDLAVAVAREALTVLKGGAELRGIEGAVTRLIDAAVWMRHVHAGLPDWHDVDRHQEDIGLDDLTLDTAWEDLDAALKAIGAGAHAWRCDCSWVPSEDHDGGGHGGS